MRRTLLWMAAVGAVMAQTTQLDPTQLKQPIKAGVTLPASCAAGDLFFKTDAQPGSNLYGCSPANVWSVQGGLSQNCQFDTTAQILKCYDGAGNLFTPVKTSIAGTPNQWVDFITPAGAPHTSQPTAAGVQNAVDQTANYSNPAWISSLAWSKLSGVPASFNAGQLQGRNLASTTPNDLQYLGWNNAAAQWEAKTLPATVSTVFGRPGAVAAQAGDYTAAQVTNAVDQTASYSNPAWISSLAWSKLNGVPASFNAGQLLGRNIANTIPNDLQYLGWDNAASQWEPRTLPPPAVSTVFGRSGAITAQTGDYGFAQISGAAAASQLPTVAMRTDQSNTISSGTQDFSNAAHTLPMKTGAAANRPTTCTTGETYFATDSPAGTNLYGCTAANTWTSQGTASALSIASDGAPVGNRTTLNFVTGTGLMNTAADTGSQINVQIGLDTAVVQTQASEQGGTTLFCASTSGSGSVYQCSMSPTLSAYTKGMVLHWLPDVNGLGGSTTLNIDQLGAAAVTLQDGITNPGASDIAAGRMYELWYDGNIFRVLTNNGSGGSGSITSVFGRTGAVVAHTGDYSASQITGLAAVATSGSYNDLSNKPGIPAAQVNADWNAGSGAAQILNKPAIPGVPSTSSLLKGDGMGNTLAATPGTDYMTSATAVLPSQLPTPGSVTLGGVQSKDCTGNGSVQKIGADGTVTCSGATGGTSGTLPATTSLLKGDGAGNAIAGVPGSDYMTPSTVVLGSQMPNLFPTAGTGQFWPFGWPYNTVYASLANSLVGCMAACNFYAWEFAQPIYGRMTVRNIVFRQGTTADSGKVIAAAIYDSTQTLLGACTTAQSLSTTNTTITCPLTASLTLTPGTYILAMVSNSNSATFYNSTTSAILAAMAPSRYSYITGGVTLPSISGSAVTWPGSLIGATKGLLMTDPPAVLLTQ